jgi:hypothetical protein
MSEMPHAPESDRDRLMSGQQEQRDRMWAAFRKLGGRWWLTCFVTGLLLLGCVGWLVIYGLLPSLGIIAPPWVKYLDTGVVVVSGVPLIILSRLLPKTGKEK